MAHSKGVIHRDLKPENILMVNNKSTKLTDFGIAKSEQGDTHTQIGVAIGTPRYMAPEQMFGSAEIGPYTDIYSLFVILYELIAHISDCGKYQCNPIPNISELAKHNKFKTHTSVPMLLHDFILKGLSLSHADRYQSITAVIKAFKPLFKQLQSKNNSLQAADSDEDETTGFFTTGTVVTQSRQSWSMDDQTFTAMREHLSDLMGPMADFLLSNAMKTAQSHDQFIMQIAEKIDNHSIRDLFVDQWRVL